MKPIAATVVVAAVLLLGCSQGSDDPTPVGQGSSIPVARAHEFGLPEAFPLPEGATEANLVTSGTTTVNVRFLVDRTPEQIEAFYGTELRKNGWRVAGIERAAELLITINFEGNGYAGSVAVVKEDPPVQVVVTIRDATLGPDPSADG